MAESISDRIEAYAKALLEVARAEGMLGEVEDDLFRFARVVRGQRRAAHGAHRPVAAGRPPAWRSSRSSWAARRSTSRRRSRRSSSASAGRTSCPAIVGRFVELAAAERAARGGRGPQRGAARRRASAPVSPTALSQATGKRVEVKVIVDEKVLGGIVARIGDTVIDGTVRHRLEQLKETI